jgi:serine/threonine protein kinase
VGAVAYIHGKQCVHRDLKLENVLLDKNENVKLCDFGFTREYEGTTNYLSTFCGTVCYSAPEMLRGEKYAGEKVDVWSLGIVLFALLRGELPFDEDDDVVTKAKILRDEPAYPEEFSPLAKSLISKLLSKRPLYRPALGEVLMDPFLAEHAPAQQAILKLTQPAPFTTDLEKTTLERMRSAGVDIDKVIENVLAQRCDTLAGWWALLIEKEERKEARRERKRKEREADTKVLRRLSGASARLNTAAPSIAEMPEDGERKRSIGERPRSSSRGRGRANRRSTPQILVSDLPQLPEGSAVMSPGPATPPPPPVEKDSSYFSKSVTTTPGTITPGGRANRSIRSNSGSRPPIPPKERRRRSSTLQLVMQNPDLLGPIPNPGGGIQKRQSRLSGKKQNQFLNQLGAIKHWFVESAKRARSPGGKPSPTSARFGTPDRPPLLSVNTDPEAMTSAAYVRSGLEIHSREVSGATNKTRSSYGATLTPTSSRLYSAMPDNTIRRRRTSLSPSPITPRSSTYRRSSGLRGRKSTSSSVSSVRSMPRHHGTTHSKASSISSNSIETSTIHSPGSRSKGRSPHPRIKVLPVTPSTVSFPSNIRIVRNPPQRPLSGTFRGGYIHMSDTPPLPSLNPITSNGSLYPVPSATNTTSSTSDRSGGVIFAKRKKHTFKGPMLNSAAFFGLGSVGESKNFPKPSLTPSFMPRDREGSDGRLNLGLRDIARKASGKGSSRRKSQIIEEEDEEESQRHSNIMEEDEEGEEEEEDDVEEVEAFSPVEADLERGEMIHSINIWDDPVELMSDRDRPPSILIPPGAGDGILEEGEDDEDEVISPMSHPEVIFPMSHPEDIPPTPLPKDDHDRPPPSRPTTRGTLETGSASVTTNGSRNSHIASQQVQSQGQDLKVPKSRSYVDAGVEGDGEGGSPGTKMPRNAFQRAASYARKKRDGAPETPPKGG